MITFKQYLSEARMAPLYHATSVNNAAMIMKTNTLLGKTLHKRVPNQPRVKGSSFTRNFKYATYFGYHDAGWNDVIVFEVDQQKLNQRNRIVPFNYWNTVDDLDVGYSNKARESQSQPNLFIASNNEFEEFVVGDVKNFNRCITRIIVTSQLTMERAGVHPELADHPLLWDKTDARYKGKWANK